jgi:hypothetical protein
LYGAFNFAKRRITEPEEHGTQGDIALIGLAVMGQNLIPT